MCCVCFSLLKVQALAPLADVLAASNTRVVFIGSSTPDQMAEYRERTALIPFCGDLFTDPSVILYKHFSLKRGMFRSLVRPFYTGFKTYGVKGVIEGWWRDCKSFLFPCVTGGGGGVEVAVNWLWSASWSTRAIDGQMVAEMKNIIIQLFSIFQHLYVSVKKKLATPGPDASSKAV